MISLIGALASSSDSTVSGLISLLNLVPLDLLGARSAADGAEPEALVAIIPFDEAGPESSAFSLIELGIEPPRLVYTDPT
mmetsp:Transcript_12845/g.24026  ORF Transcript_12845/g.24026 Transcript_12845/m.24026 type:complete len:80 (-) Transcript_12845:287-526(-)